MLYDITPLTALPMAAGAPQLLASANSRQAPPGVICWTAHTRWCTPPAPSASPPLRGSVLLSRHHLGAAPASLCGQLPGCNH